MGHVLFSIRDFYDSTSELVGIKSGILLNRFDISKILVDDEYDDEFLLTDNLDSFIRLGSSEITDMVISLRRKLGNFPLNEVINKDYKIIEDYVNKTGDINFYGLSSIGLRLLLKNPNITNNELSRLIREEESVDKILADAVANIAFRNHDTSIILSGNTDWNGITPLSELFETEVKPKNKIEFIEQKFIDYLAVNGHEIEKIHWRNFERFCAEFFRREGYTAILGPGTNDGGIDIRVFKDSDTSTSPFILIQCKRYKEDNKVTIETVKSFYADVLFEGAQEGLIATTGYIASGGKKVCTARKYNINFAEKNNVFEWAKNMRTYK